MGGGGERERNFVVSFLIKSLIPLGQGYPPHDLITLLPYGPSPSAVTLGIMALTCMCLGAYNLVHKT